MKTHSLILIGCLAISTGCLGTGYILAGYWLILPVFPIIALIWTFMNKHSVFWSTSTFLFVYVILVALGIMLDLNLIFMLIACTTALICWDLILFKKSVAGNLPGKTNLALEKKHLTSLTLAASAGLMLALISVHISLYIPFVVISFLVLVTMGCLIYGMQFVANKNH